MKRKYYILGVLALLCLLGTGYYAWTLYVAYRKQVAEWNEGAKAAFEEALWMEVNKRAEDSFYSSSSGDEGMRTLNTKMPDTVFVTSVLGRKGYHIERFRYENSLIKETRGRVDLTTLFKRYPLSVDTLALELNDLLQDISVQIQIRYVYTDLDLINDTVFSYIDKRFTSLDSLTVKYLGFRCEHEVVAYVSYPYWMNGVAYSDWGIFFFPWLLLLSLFIGYPKLEKFVLRKMTHVQVIEKTIEVEKEIIVEKEIHVVNVQINKAGIFDLPDGTVFDSFSALLVKDGIQQNLQPQSVLLLKLFLNKDSHQLTSDEICMELWNEKGHSARLYSAIRRLRKDLEHVKSALIVTCSSGVYELKSPISSHNF